VSTLVVLSDVVLTGITGFAYFGVNADKVHHLHNLSWSSFLSDTEGIRVEDIKVPLQAYP
jgi:hypothetical protein